jgi:hypothetical protein
MVSLKINFLLPPVYYLREKLKRKIKIRHMELQKFQYDNEISKNFAVATMFWGLSECL